MRFFILSILSLSLTACANQSLAQTKAVEAAEKPFTPRATVSTARTVKTPPKAKKLIAGKYRVRSTQRGKMSWYSVKTNGGTETASGKRFTNNGATAAHRKLKFGTKVRVTNLRNKKSEIVTITDRGPFKKGRIIDVSIGTAEKLGFVNAGVVPCKVEVLKTAS